MSFLLMKMVGPVRVSIVGVVDRDAGKEGACIGRELDRVLVLCMHGAVDSMLRPESTSLRMEMRTLKKRRRSP
jgi:hypothetical protein